PTFPKNIYKARLTGAPNDKYCEDLKAAGFDGMEVNQWNTPTQEAQKIRQLTEKHNLRIHSVLYGWADFNIAEKFKPNIQSVTKALKNAAAYGADTLLLVTCKVGGMKMPAAWDFDIDFDPTTLKVKTVAQGDNTPYQNYINTQNKATENSIRAIEELIPIAAYEGVRIGIENVWNNLWCTPKFFAAFCKYFNNTWVGSYLDLGNHTKYSKIDEWIKELGNSILKLHIKGYKITETKGNAGGGVGEWTTIDKATIDWKNVRKLLADVKYSGWMTIEENGLNNQQYNNILDKIIAGE
ncbi:MAG: sugar phosphate isomerase/epimerase, partial [Planctomycetaceae bacterium]|nr:sugar phosphate isomerase/epimerase [Planctomycetaceae bacterium]